MNCSSLASPIQFALQPNVSVFDGTRAARGITFGLGSPPQYIMMLPSIMSPNFYINMLEVCSNMTTSGCTHQFGKIYNSSVSSTYVPKTRDTWAGTWDANADWSPMTFFNDKIETSDFQFQNDSLPLIGFSPTWKGPACFPLAVGSSFVDQMAKTGQIPSNTWAIWAGDDSHNGSLILGGYAEKYVTGYQATMNTPDDCPICVRMSSLSIETSSSNRTFVSPVQGNDFWSFLEAYEDYVALPGDIWDSIAKHLGGKLGPENLMVFDSGTEPVDGRMNVHLTGGVTVTIPYENLFSKGIHNVNGRLVTLEPNQTMIRLVRSGGSMGLFGTPLMSGMYLIRDNERKTIKLSNINSSATIGPGDVTAICSSSMPAQSSAGGSGSRSDVVVIAATVISAVVAFVVAIVIAGFIICRRKQRLQRILLPETVGSARSSQSSALGALEKPSVLIPSSAVDTGIAELSSPSSSISASSSSNELPCGSHCKWHELYSRQRLELNAEDENVHRAELPAVSFPARAYHTSVSDGGKRRHSGMIGEGRNVRMEHVNAEWI